MADAAWFARHTRWPMVRWQDVFQGQRHVAVHVTNQRFPAHQYLV